MFCVSCLDIRWRHNIWLSQKRKGFYLLQKCSLLHLQINPAKMQRTQPLKAVFHKFYYGCMTNFCFNLIFLLVWTCSNFYWFNHEISGLFPLSLSSGSRHQIHFSIWAISVGLNVFLFQNLQLGSTRQWCVCRLGPLRVRMNKKIDRRLYWHYDFVLR